MIASLGQSALYGAAIGLQRGLPLLCLFPATALLGIDDYAIYAISQTIVLLMAGLLSINGAAAVLREGVANDTEGADLIWQFSGLTVLCTALGLGVAMLLNQPLWVLFAIATAGFEAVHLMYFSLIRARSRADLYLTLSAIRAVAILASLGVCFLLPSVSLNMVLAIQLVVYMAVTVLGAWFLKITPGGSALLVGGVAWRTLAYTAPLVLHMSGLWVLSSANRLILLEQHGATVSGAYSALFAMSTPMLLVCALLGVIVPASQFKAFEIWRSGKMSLKVIVISALALLVAYIAVRLGVYLALRYELLPDDGMSDAPIVITLLCANSILMCGYIIYGNYYLFFRKSVVFSSITIFVSVFHVIISWNITYNFSMIGASVASCVSYLLYFMSMVISFKWYDQKIMHTGLRDALLIILFAIVIIVIGSL